MAGMSYYDFPPELQEIILEWLSDPLEVARMRATNRQLREALTSPEYVSRYNQRQRHRNEVSWSFAHNVTDQLPGFIRGLRFDDGSTAALPLPILVHADEFLGLLCVSGSYSVFVRARNDDDRSRDDDDSCEFVDDDDNCELVDDDDSCELVVVHLTTRGVDVISCPSPHMEAVHFMENRPNLMIFPYFRERAPQYLIVHVMVDGFNEPEVSIYNSAFENWTSIRAQAFNNESDEFRQIADLDTEFAMTFANDIGFFYLEIHDSRPFYSVIPIDEVFPGYDTPAPDDFFEPIDGLDWSITRHFAAGDHLWAASIFTHHHVQRRFILKCINIYRFSPETNTYVYFDSTPIHRLNPSDFMIMAAPSIQATSSMVQVGIICTNANLQGWRAKVFACDIASGDWYIREDPPPFRGVVLSDPFLSSRLTL